MDCDTCVHCVSKGISFTDGRIYYNCYIPEINWKHGGVYTEPFCITLKKQSFYKKKEES